MLLGGAALPLGDHVRKPSAGSADLRADLPPPVPQSCDGPVADRLGQRQGAELARSWAGPMVLVQDEACCRGPFAMVRSAEPVCRAAL